MHVNFIGFCKRRLNRLLLGLSAFSFISIFFTLWYKLENVCKFSDSLSSSRADIITISGILTGIIIAYLTSKVLQVRSENISKLPELKLLTQKIHKFRGVVNSLVYSNLWVKGLNSFINQKYRGLSYFDVREIWFVDGQVTAQAEQFNHDHEFGDAANLFLELKSFFFEEYPLDDTLYSEFDVPVYYQTEILEK